uniref:Uncharacterized protein n=2 Tax=unclassified Caudoviricetes TaxID=2788787 RepID=A0A8S5R9K3_9CAUD|nr:MAG TPA: hypothetical protein [Siphoviridae sp. ctobd83]DAE28031.1 MAG TPA: hypothetical protein [Siphoviridae sp. ctHNH2]
MTENADTCQNRKKANAKNPGHHPASGPAPFSFPHRPSPRVSGAG